MPRINGFECWVESAMNKVLPKQDPPEQPDTNIVVDCARNEHESAQIIIRSDHRVAELSVKTSRIRGRSPVVPRLKAHFAMTVPVKYGTSDTLDEDLFTKAPADIPDPLSHAHTITLARDTNQTLWVTIEVTPRTSPGTYTGTVRVSADKTHVDIPVAINVHSARVPNKRNLYVTNWFSPSKIAESHSLELWSEPFWKKLAVWARFMSDHRQNTVLTPITELITASIDDAGDMDFDFSRFDRWVNTFFTAGFNTIEGGHLGGRKDWEAPDFDAYHMQTTLADGTTMQDPKIKVSSQEQRDFLSKFLPALQKHLKEKGWLDSYLQHLCDEPITANADSYNKLASYVREFAPEFRIIDASMCKEIIGNIDVWVPHPRRSTRTLSSLKSGQRPGMMSGYTPACPLRANT